MRNTSIHLWPTYIWEWVRRVGWGSYGLQLEKYSRMTQMADFRVTMASTSTHNGPVFHYKAQINIWLGVNDIETFYITIYWEKIIVTGPAKTSHICTNYTCLEIVLYLVTVYDKHILQTVSAFLLIYSCSMNVSVTYLEYFKKYGKLKFNN